MRFLVALGAFALTLETLALDLDELSRPRIETLFGALLGERLSDQSPAYSGPDGLLYAPFEPQKPLLAFESYVKTALPKTRTVVSIQGVSAFGEKNEAANLVYDRYHGVLRKQYGGKLQDADGLPKEQEGETILKQSAVVGKDGRLLLFSLVKVSEQQGLAMRLILSDAKALERVQDKLQTAMSASLDGIFGIRFGSEVCEGAQPQPNGFLLAAFEPSARFCGFTYYYQISLPKSRRVSRLCAVRDFENKLAADACFDRIQVLFKEKYGRRMADIVVDKTFDTPQERALKRGQIGFSNYRTLLLEYLYLPQTDGYRLRIIADDGILSGQLEAERKALQQERDAADINAL